MLTYRLARAGLRDVEEILALQTAYYAEDGIETPLDARRRALAGLLSDCDLGAVWLVSVDGRPAGYVAVCFGYSLELGGRDAFVDELFVTAELRGNGLGRKLLERALAAGRADGVRAFHLEAAEGNEAAQTLYADFGFRPRKYGLMTRVE